MTPWNVRKIKEDMKIFKEGVGWGACKDMHYVPVIVVASRGMSGVM